MTTSKNGRVMYVDRLSLGSRGRAENQPITNKCAENYQPITNEWSIGTRGCAENYFVEFVFRKITRTS